MRGILNEAREWARGRQWVPRALLLVSCAWIFFRHLHDPMYGGIVKGLNLALHEIGHVLFGFIGEFIGIAGGTIFQLAAPLLAGWMFWRQRDFFAIAVAMCWLGTNFFDVAVYAADARAADLPLVGLGGADPEHDWFILLAETDLLYKDKLIGGIFRWCGILSFAAGLGFGGWLVAQTRKTDMRRSITALVAGAALLTSGCAYMQPFKQREPTFGKSSSLTFKPVSSKRDPVYLIAMDGSECTVNKKRFAKVAVGESVLCLWQPPR